MKTLLALGIVSMILFPSCSIGEKAKNVLIITVDTLRADHLGCYGYDRNTSPNIDRLAQEGVLFEKFYCPMPTTLPSHASLMTSKYPRSLGVTRNGDVLRPEEDTLAEILQRNGYATAAFVSAFVLEHRFGLNQGFDLYHDQLDAAGEQKAENTFVAAKKWLLQKHKRPFFLWVHFYDPHTPYVAPKPFQHKFSPHNTLFPQELEFVKDPSKFSPQIIEATIAAYDDEIAYTDHYVGELMKLLEKLQLKSNTLIVLTADHGESLVELLPRYGYVFDHGEFLYAHQLHIPLIVRFPEPIAGFVPGSKQSELHDSTDIMPTVLDWLDIKTSTAMSGRSILHQGEKPYVVAQRRSFLYPPKNYLKGIQYSLINKRWHLITSTTNDRELYDFAHDSLERVNIAAKNTAQLQQMEEKLSIWLDTVDNRAIGPLPLEKDVRKRLKSLGYLE